MYFLSPSHLLDKVFSFLESLQNAELNLYHSQKNHTGQVNLEFLLTVQYCLQTRVLKSIVPIAVLLAIDNVTVLAKMFENTNALHEMTLRKKNPLF